MMMTSEEFYRGVDEKRIKTKNLSRKIRFVPRKHLCLKPRDNMKWGKEDATDEEIYQALDIAQAKNLLIRRNRD